MRLCFLSIRIERQCVSLDQNRKWQTTSPSCIARVVAITTSILFLTNSSQDVQLGRSQFISDMHSGAAAEIVKGAPIFCLKRGLNHDRSVRCNVPPFRTIQSRFQNGGVQSQKTSYGKKAYHTMNGHMIRWSSTNRL